MAILKNRRLEVFAHDLTRGLSPADAARAAGYNVEAASFEANARQRASFPEVKARVAELQQRAAEKTTVDLAWILERLVKVAGIALDEKEIKTADVLRATELIIKIKGYFAPEKREVLQRLTELTDAELGAFDERLAAAEQKSEQETAH